MVSKTQAQRMANINWLIEQIHKHESIPTFHELILIGMNQLNVSERVAREYAKIALIRSGIK